MHARVGRNVWTVSVREPDRRAVPPESQRDERIEVHAPLEFFRNAMID